MFLPFQTSEKCHWITHVLSEGIDFSVFFNSFFCHCSLLYQPMLLGGGGCCMSILLFSSCIALLFHATRKNYPTLIHSFGRGLILYLYIHTFLSRIPSIILHASLIPNFRKFHSTTHPSMLLGGVDVAVNSSFFILHCSVIPCY